MKISDIDAHLDALKLEALSSLGVSADEAQQLSLADSPDPTLGDRGFPVFALAKTLRKGPPMIAKELVALIEPKLADDPLVESVIAAGPYVNFKLDRARVAALTLSQAIAQGDRFCADFLTDPSHWMIEYSAPNTNKPQHLGHVRNNLLGAAVANILTFAGNRVTRVNLINDRGIHICKSMLAYKLFGDGQTPESTGIKGDHLVGRFYVVFNTKFEAEYAEWQQSAEAQQKLSDWLATPAAAKLRQEDAEKDLSRHFFKEYKDTFFNNESALGQQTKAMLVAWEEGDAEVLALWNTMNQWVFDGFDQTYSRLGVGFEHVYYESQTYLLGKDLVLQGLERGIFERLDGGAIVCDLQKIGLDGQKVLLRSDGTSVYMTQDLGTAMTRFDEHQVDHMIYVVGDEQRHHFRVLFGILGLLREELAGHLTHLSYGMVELPRGMGRMKSREGTTVDADDLMQEMFEQALNETRERYPDLSEEEQAQRAEAIGMAALKFFILFFNPTTTVHFDPSQAIDFRGKTGPYVMYAYARIQSIGREFGGWPELSDQALREACATLGTRQELDVLNRLRAWPHSLAVAARDLDPSKVASYAYDLASDFSTLYNHSDHVIKNIEGPRRDALLVLSRATGEALRSALTLLGIQTLEQM